MMVHVQRLTHPKLRMEPANSRLSRIGLSFALALMGFGPGTPSFSQQVCLPAPRLLTVTPMGGQVGTNIEVSITGENIEEVSALVFSTPQITATPVVGADGKSVQNKFLVTIAADAPVGVHDARVRSRLGISAARAFSVGRLPEVTRSSPNNSVETAMAMKLNSVCNAVTTKRLVDFYSFQGVKGKRVVADCAATGIDSKLTSVVIIADAQGRDLLVNRTGGVLDFTPPADGTYLIKLHSLTFQGGAQHFYRLALQEVPGIGPVPRQPATAAVGSMSWPPEGLAARAKANETEPNNQPAQAQKLTLPCDIEGSFFPAADVDTFEFSAKKGETWWVEVASERLGLPTDPFVLVQRVTKTGDKETLADVAELHDISSPMKPGTYVPAASYNGPPYDAGSPDVLGKVEIKEDGVYRLQLRDLFGGTRSDAGNVYRLIIRQAAPDFKLVAWAAHMSVRQNDFGTISKPIALRAGTTMAFEVVVVRRDGFDGDIELHMEGLPPGVTARGLKIPAGNVQGMIFITAADNAKPAFSIAKMFGRTSINAATVTRPCLLASMEWPVEYAPSDFPTSRLMADVPVSVSDSEKAPVTIAASENKVWEARAGETLKIPLKITWRNDFNGTSIKFKAYGTFFGNMKEIDVPIKAATSEAVVDLAALKTAPGDYTLAFKGIGITKYHPSQIAVKMAEEQLKKAKQEVAILTAGAKNLAEKVTTVPAAEKAAATNAAKIALGKQKLAEAAVTDATNSLKTITAAAAPKDILDIFVSEPIQVSIKAAQVATAAATPKK
jgi:hypothetical protein